MQCEFNQVPSFWQRSVYKKKKTKQKKLEIDCEIVTYRATRLKQVLQQLLCVLLQTG